MVGNKMRVMHPMDKHRVSGHGPVETRVPEYIMSSGQTQYKRISICWLLRLRFGLWVYGIAKRLGCAVDKDTSDVDAPLFKKPREPTRRLIPNDTGLKPTVKII